MMEYTFRIKEGRKTIPITVFTDRRYALAGEFLLAERSILKEINALLQNEGDGELSGNIFSLRLSGSDAEITNEITGSELTVTRDELKALAADYSAEVKRLRKRS